jgi:integrase
VEDIRATFRRDLKPRFGDRSIASIRRTDVQSFIDDVGERSGSAANKAHKWLRKMLAFAVDRGDLASSPMESMRQPHQEGKRKRVLRGDEIARVWDAAGDMGAPFGPFVQLLILLGQRLREVAEMKWEEVELDAGEWIIPGARTKNKRDHMVPLSPQALKVLLGLQPEPCLRKGYVFTTTGRSPIAGFSKGKKRLDDLVFGRVKRAASGTVDLPIPLEPWVFHDLRRSLATGCQALGIPIEHTEAVLNHVSGSRGGLAAIYQLHEYKEEKTAALNAWGRHVEALLSGREGSNIIPLRARAT